MLLVGNKCDQHDDRMVTMDEGHKRHKDIFCESFHEISVRESYDEVYDNSWNQSNQILLSNFLNCRCAMCSKMCVDIGESLTNARN